MNRDRHRDHKGYRAQIYEAVIYFRKINKASLLTIIRNEEYNMSKIDCVAKLTTFGSLKSKVWTLT